MSDWIKCSERLPESRHPQGAVVVKSHISQNPYVTAGNYDPEEGRWIGYFSSKSVTHWRPMFELPEKEQRYD